MFIFVVLCIRKFHKKLICILISTVTTRICLQNSSVQTEFSCQKVNMQKKQPRSNREKIEVQKP